MPIHRIQENVIDESIQIELLANIIKPSVSINAKLHSLISYIKDFLDKNVSNLSRINIIGFHDILSNIFGSYAAICGHRSDLIKFFVSLKRLVSGYRSIVALSLPSGILSANDMAHLQLCVDAAIYIESFASKMHTVPYEFREFVGFFEIRKLHQFGTMNAGQNIKASRYGLKRDRRKLHIELLHLPPEESRALPSQSTAVASDSCQNKLLPSPEKVKIASSSNQGNDGRKKIELQIESDASLDSDEKSHKNNDNNLLHDEEATNEAQAAAKKKSSSLASSLAAARAARLSGNSASNSVASSNLTVNPISISRPTSTTASKKPSLDF